MWFDTQKVHAFSASTVSSAGRGQHGLLIISCCLKTSLPCPWRELFYTSTAKARSLYRMCQCYTFPCRSYLMRAVNVHISLAFPSGKRQVHKCSTDHLFSAGPIQNSEGHPPTDARDQLHYKFFAFLTCFFSQLSASSPRGLSSTA